MKLSEEQIQNVVKDTLENDRLLSNEIMRAGGDRHDFQAAYEIWFWRK